MEKPQVCPHFSTKTDDFMDKRHQTKIQDCKITTNEKETEINLCKSRKNVYLRKNLKE